MIELNYFWLFQGRLRITTDKAALNKLFIGLNSAKRLVLYLTVRCVGGERNKCGLFPISFFVCLFVCLI